MTKFSDAMAALTVDDANANISLIKGAVKSQVEANDSRVQIEMTDHFNHSFVPDLILSWPGVKESRHVYLRTAFRSVDLLRDIETLKRSRPILLPLGPVAIEEDSEPELNSSAQANNMLIANPEGLETLESETAARPVVSLLSHAVLQGGRGLMTPADARESSTELDEGFEAAREGDATKTSVAIESAAELLDSDHAGRINRLLHAVWVGSGASGSSFPGAAGITATLDAESLRFVLDLPDVEDEEFWRRLGSGLTLGRLCELRDLDSENLQRLLKDNAYRLVGKAARVVRAGVKTPAPRWSVVNANLVLAVSEDRIHFAPSKLDQLPQVGDPVSVSVAQLQTRCQESGVKIREVRLASGDNSVSYANQADGDIIAANEIAQLQAVMPRGTLTSAVAITGTHDMNLTFGTRTANGYGPARFPLSTFLGVVAPVLVGSSADVTAEVQAMVEQPASSRAPEDSDGEGENSRDADPGAGGSSD